MGRSTVYHTLVTEEDLKNVKQENTDLAKEWIEYLKSVDRSPETIYQYQNDLKIFFVWNLKHNANRIFTDIKKREFVKFQNMCINEWGWSSSRTRRVKSTLSSFSDYIENFWDDEFPNFRNVISKIPSPVKNLVRDKTVFTPDEVEHILDCLIKDEKYPQMAAFALAAYSGRRKAELIQFKMSYFTDENVISGSLWKSPEKIRTKGRGKEGKQLNVYTVKKGFEPYLNIWKDYRERNNIDTDWYLYDPADPSQPASISLMDSYGNVIQRYTEKPFYFHALRHYACSELMRAGLPATVVKSIFGWSDLSLVDLYYDRDTDEEIAEYFKDGDIVAKNTSIKDL